DPKRKLTYRRVERYLTAGAVPMKEYAEVRKGAPRGATISFHRPLQDYVNALAAEGLWVDALVELPDPVKDEEGRSNPEIPWFVARRARRVAGRGRGAGVPYHAAMPDPRCPAVRALTAAATLCLCVSHASAPGGQAAGGPDAATTVLACQVAQSLPVPPAEAREGGFAFVFESLGGTAADGRACTAYRLRNLPGSPPTPVRWAAGSEVLVDVARLARCPRDQECPWLEVARYFDGDFVGGETTIGSGLHADSFPVTSPGLVAFSSPDVGAAAASVGTEVAGTVVDSQGRAVALDLVVKSRFERGEDGLTLVYEATADDPT